MLSRLCLFVFYFFAVYFLFQWPGSEFECTSRAQILKFADIVGSYGIPTTIRVSKGRDIDGACGQLAVHQQKNDTSAMIQETDIPSKSLESLMTESDPMQLFPVRTATN